MRCVLEDFRRTTAGVLVWCRVWRMGRRFPCAVLMAAFLPRVSVIGEMWNGRSICRLRHDPDAAGGAEAGSGRTQPGVSGLFENNPHPMWIFDMERCVLAVNAAAVARYGYSAEEFRA